MDEISDSFPLLLPASIRDWFFSYVGERESGTLRTQSVLSLAVVAHVERNETRPVSTRRRHTTT